MRYPDGFKFELLHTDGAARLGRLTTPHGIVDTPFFMPVGTQGVVKTLTGDDLEAMGAQIFLINTYHLYLRPGVDVIERMGRIHKFAAWPKALLSDSGGYQVFSHHGKTKITDDGVRFQSHIDGSYHDFTPEKVIEIQRRLGPDIIMSFDECVPYPATRDDALQGVEQTTRWAARGVETFERLDGDGRFPSQLLHGIVQGSVYDDLRRKSAEDLLAMDFPGYSIGGLSVGEPKEEMGRMLDVTLPLLPTDRQRYLMGVGYPEDILMAVEKGIDMFDCVLPTRNARTGLVFTSFGQYNFRNATAADDDRPLDPDCSCPVCRRYSRGYIRHLYGVNEITAHRMATYHSVHFFIKLMEGIRRAIADNRFAAFKRDFLARYSVSRPESLD
ncbi:MAG: tRNA guanosine(34) transglycosylase Tgt [candidate division Zixibacteria bacterium]|nr:tRNA guanosine(34) transglycosylase Tgt [candidate division Zixibacteria bacterium]